MSPKRRTPADEPFLLVRSSSSDMPAGPIVRDHRHDWHQLVYVASGLMAVRTGGGAWLAPPSWAIWVPAQTDHAIRFVGRSRLRTIYLRPGPLPARPDECRSLAVSPLLRELILRTVRLGMLDEREPAERAVAELILAELGEAGPPPLRLPQPTSPPTREAARLLAENARGVVDLAGLARAVGMGARTLERRFRDETGLTLGRWQQQSRLLIGLELIASGRLVKVAADAAGFASPSAYVAAFRKTFGTTPARYFQHAAN